MEPLRHAFDSAFLRIAACSLTLGIAAACSRDAPAPPAATSYGQTAAELPAASDSAAPTAAARSAIAADAPLVVFLGDSLTAGLGLEEEEAFPARIAALLAEKGTPVRVVNAGVSGDTSAGGLARLDWLLRQKPDVLVVELGANDGLRGQPVAATEQNLREIVLRARAAGSRVLLTGMQVPPNYGPEYGRSFAAMFPHLATDLGVPLVPFLLEGVAAEPGLNLPDGIHPTAEGHERVAAHVLPYVEEILRGSS